ncbi:MAG: hypothetical protein KA248_10170 [Kiritimatiellae bacterium]|nr:hypothetical protein [Kiritimatiellia bacterium]
MKRFAIGWVVLVLLAGVAGTLAGSVWINEAGPAYGTIQAAVNAASSGNQICISTSVFPENVVVSDKDLTLRGGYDESVPIHVGGYSVINAGGSGGALSFIRSISTVNYLKLQNGNRGGDGGGGAHLVSSTVDFNDVHWINNYGLNGGGLYVDSQSEAGFYNASTISNCYGVYGGAAFVAGKLNLYNGSRIVCNRGTNEGGGVFVWTNAELTAWGTLFHSNTAVKATARGGAVYAATNSEVVLWEGSVIQSNRAYEGGGLWGSGGWVVVVDCSFIGNTADSSGGAIYGENLKAFAMRSKGLFNVTSPSNVVQNNQALYGGGMMFISSPIVISNALVMSNTALYGGGIYYIDAPGFAGATIRCARVVANMAVDPVGLSSAGGGGIYASFGHMLLDGVNIMTNYSDGHGGGVLALNDARISVESSSRASIVEYNAAAHSGGGFYVNGTNALRILGRANEPSWVDWNRAWESGGGVYARYLSITGAVMVNNNRCATNGGGVCVLDKVDVLGGTNAMVQFIGNWADQNGGGLYIGPEGSVYSVANITSILSGVTFDNNRAIASGGGVYLKARSANIGPAAFTENWADQYSGGGLAAVEAPWLLVGSDDRYFKAPSNWPTLFARNYATLHGGGLYMDSCERSTVRLSAILSNLCWNGSGGGLLANRCRFDLLDSVVANNHTVWTLGTDGVSIQNSTGWVEQCTIYSNGGYGVSFTDAGYNVNHSILWGHSIAQLQGLGFVTTRYCCVQDNWPGLGNITNNPRVMANYHLRYDSPCIEAGEAAAGSYDVDGEFRLFMKDLGCDEFVDTDLDNLANVVETGTGVYQGEYDAGTSWLQSDTDGDGTKDGDEVIADTDPTSSNSVLRFVSITRSNAWINLATDGGQQAYRVYEWRTAMMDTNQWIVLWTNTPPMPNRTNLLVSFGVPDDYYFRVRAFRDP